MRDEEYLFKEDVREKAITARSAKKRPRHSGCRLPQYTAKEMREMSGTTYTLNLKKTYHIRRVQSTSRGLAEELRAEHYRQVPRRAFGSCRAYGRERRCGRRLPEQERLFLQARFSAYEGRPREIPRGLWYQHECADKKITLENFSFCFSGAFNAASFVKQIKAFVPEVQLLRVSVAVEVVEPEPSATEPATEERP